MFDELKRVEDGYLDADGCHWDSKIDYVNIGILRFCGCGSPEECTGYVRDMLLEHAANSECWKQTSYEDLATMFFLQWATNEKYIEHGTTIRCSWLTKKGEELISAIECAFKEEVKDEDTV